MFLTGLLIALNIRKRKSKSFDRVDNLILILIITMKTLNLQPLTEVEMNETTGGIFPIIILGVVITAKTAAWIAAGTIAVGTIGAGCYVGYQEAAAANR